MGNELASRRALLRTLAGGALLGAAASSIDAASPKAALTGTESLRSAFDGMVAALAGGDIDGFWSYFHPSVTMIDEDAPWRFDLAGIKDHIGFHASPGIWEGFAWKPRENRIVVNGSTGVVAGGATFRGKPKDAGYRLRHLLFVQGWTREADRWRMVVWHQSPIIGHVSNGSPG